MTLLVITPTLGVSRWLDATIDAVNLLAAPKRHVLVCPAAVRDSLARAFPHVELVTDEGRGIYAALNRGLAAGGDWEAFTWINDDDVLVAEGMDEGWAGLQRDDSAEVIYGQVDYVDAAGRSLGPLPVCRRAHRLRALFSAGLPALTQHGTLVRRGLAERLGGFDPRYALAGDFDYWVRAVQMTEKFRHVGRLMARYRLHRGQLSNDLQRLDQEIAASARRHFAALPAAVRCWRRLGFRAAHGPDLLRRFARTGCWRTSSLYRRAAALDTEGAAS